MSTKSLPATQLFRDFLGKFHSRKLLLQNPLTQQPVTAPPPSTPDNAIDNSLDSNVLMVLSVLFCGLICSIVLNSLFRFVLTRCSRLMIASGPNANSSSSSLKSSSGVMKKALRTFPVVKYSAELKLPGLNTECVVCLLEFTSGERVRLLPKCNHGFHIWCVDKWLRSHSSCPKCRRCLVETCEKIVGNTGSHASSSGLPAPAPVPETVVSIRPLDPEGISRNYGGLS